MAAQVKEHSQPHRKRVFVLVDKNETQGVFSSWDAAESYADENRFSLDHLLEFETKADHPDHLHLMAAQWEGGWKFVGLWSTETPAWKTAPLRIRLDHYHAMGSNFKILRQKEFKWRPGLLPQINPMAPDAAWKIDSQIKTIPSTKPQQWKPKLSPLRPREINREPAPETKPAPQISPEKAPESPNQDSTKDWSAPKPPEDKQKPKLSISKSGDAASLDDKSGASDAIQTEPAASAQDKKAKIKLTKSGRSRLRLKTDGEGPKPIPSFQATPAATSHPSGLHEMTDGPEAPAPVLRPQPSQESQESTKIRRVWPMRLIAPVGAIVLFWIIGVIYALKPDATTQSYVSDITSLANAQVLAIEPGQVFFQLAVDPVHQQRWVRSLGLNPIPFGKLFTLPQYHALETWAKPEGFIRPPYSELEVREWWEIRLRRISYGFFYKWEDGTILILDLQSDLFFGWGKAKHLPELMN